MVLRQEIILKSLLALIGCVILSSCQHGQLIVLHPIEKSDIFIVPKGASINIPAGTSAKYYNKKGKLVNEIKWEENVQIVSEKQGRFLSDFYLEEVVEAKAEVK